MLMSASWILLSATTMPPASMCLGHLAAYVTEASLGMVLLLATKRKNSHCSQTFEKFKS